MGTDEKAASCICIFFFFFFFLDAHFCGCGVFPVGLVHYSQDPQTSFLLKLSLKIDLTTLFTYLKIIVLQCFQFLVSVFSKISYIQAHPMYAFGLRFWFVRLRFPFSFSLFIYLFIEKRFHVGVCLSVGPMHCARDPLPL